MIFKKELEEAMKKASFDYKTCGKYSLVYGYRNSEGELKDLYFYAVLLRYWHETSTLYKEIKNLINALHLTFDDVVDLYVDSILKALNYADLSKYENKEEKERDKMLNSYIYNTIDTMRINFVQYHSYDKRKINIGAISLDNELDDDGNTLELESDDTLTKTKEFLVQIDKIINNLLKKNKYFEALTMYFIVYDDLFVFKQDTQKYEYSFKKFLSVVKDFNGVNFDNFINKYDVDEKAIDYLSMYSYYSRVWIRMLHNKAINYLKNDEVLISVCY